MYVALFALWAAAVAYSVSQYRKNRDEENLIIAEAEAAAHGDEDTQSRSSLTT